jgi:hypothetical protein
MKIILVPLLLLIPAFNPTPTAMEQIQAMKQPVVVVIRHASTNKYDHNSFMTVEDGDGNFTDLNKDSTLFYLVNKYHGGDTIR